MARSDIRTIALTTQEATVVRDALKRELKTMREQIELHRQRDESAWDWRRTYWRGTTHESEIESLETVCGCVERTLEKLGDAPEPNTWLRMDGHDFYGSPGPIDRAAGDKSHEASDHLLRSWRASGTDAVLSAYHSRAAKKCLREKDLLDSAYHKWTGCRD